MALVEVPSLSGQTIYMGSIEYKGSLSSSTKARAKALLLHFDLGERTCSIVKGVVCMHLI